MPMIFGQCDETFREKMFNCGLSSVEGRGAVGLWGSRGTVSQSQALETFDNKKMFYTYTKKVLLFFNIYINRFFIIRSFKCLWSQ